MRFFEKCKDGGPNSPVDGYVLLELKNWFTISLLKFNKGEREEYHSHAFNALSWFLSGHTIEYIKNAQPIERRGICLPHRTPRSRIHKYVSYKTSWCFTVRGPWVNWWKDGNQYLTHKRKIIAEIW